MRETKATALCLLLVLSLVLTYSHPPLREPRVLESFDGHLDITLRVQPHRVSTELLSFTTRAYCLRNDDHSDDECSVPGPTLHCRPGDTLSITLINNLDADAMSDFDLMNNLHSPNTTNLHTHGLHVDPAIDNVWVRIAGGGGRHTYAYHIPADHAPGLHWYHAHAHGSTSLQIAGGLLGAIVILPTTNSGFPPLLLDAPRRLLIFTHIDLDPAASSSNGYCSMHKAIGSTLPIDAIFLEPEVLQGWFVNGQYQPVLQLVAGQWQVFDLLEASINLILELEIRSELGLNQGSQPCFVQLLATDGVYLTHARTGLYVEHLTLVNAGRATVAVMCPTPGTYYWQTLGATSGQFADIATAKQKFNQLLITLNVAESDSSSAGYDANHRTYSKERPAEYLWDISRIPRPTYLQSLQQRPVLPRNKWSMSTLQTSCCGADGRSDAITAAVGKDAVNWLGIGSNCSIPCFDDDSCFEQFGPHFTVNDLETVQRGQCEYTSFSGPLLPSSVPGTHRSNAGAARFKTVIGEVNELQWWGSGYHPMHLHLNHFQLIAYHNTEGVEAWSTAAAFGEIGDFRDTWPALPGKTTVRMVFGDYAGEVIVHCHLTMHEDQGMMTSILVEPVSPATAGHLQSGSTSVEWSYGLLVIAAVGAICSVFLFIYGLRLKLRQSSVQYAIVSSLPIAHSRERSQLQVEWLSESRMPFAIAARQLQHYQATATDIDAL